VGWCRQEIAKEVTLLENWEVKRKKLIDHLSRQDIDTRVLGVMEEVPRHVFLPESHRKSAYEDSPQSIGHGQTISAPHMVAIMCDILDLKPGLKVLEIGAGWGYHAAVMASLVRPGGSVVAVERIESLAVKARENLEECGYGEVEVVVGDGTGGYGRGAPYDRISVACAAPDVPSPLFEQLAEGGKLVLPEGRYSQKLYLVEKVGGKMKKKYWGDVVFVPLIGEYGFPG
jgi:protein-L-isoaspartate(D-aspartate) O-methyltransferase